MPEINPIGFSTGAIFKLFPRPGEVFPRLDWLIRNMPDIDPLVRVMEVNLAYCSLLDSEFLNPLLGLLSAPLFHERFPICSVHGPGDIKYGAYGSDKIIAPLQQILNESGAQTLVVHPTVVENTDWLQDHFGGQVALETMDDNKFGSYPSELLVYLMRHAGIRIALDVNHCRSVKIGRNERPMLDQWLEQVPPEPDGRPRIVQSHISGLYKGLHVPYSSLRIIQRVRQLADLNKLPGGLPLVNEAVFETAAYDKKSKPLILAMRKEQQLVRQLLAVGAQSRIMQTRISECV